MSEFAFATIEEALAGLRAGRPVLVLDDAHRENEGDVIMAAQHATTEWLGWTIRHSSGYLCAPMDPQWADRLELPMMVERSSDPLRTAYTVSVDATQGVTTGISAHDRALTCRVLADPSSQPADLARPGHILPLRARAGGVWARRGHTEASVDLCRLAGLSPVAVIGELVHDDGSLLRTPDVVSLGARENLPVITIADLVAWRDRHDRVRRAAVATLPTEFGEFAMYGYLDQRTGSEHVALVSPRGPRAAEVPLVRVHSECLTGEALGSQRCDCGDQLRAAMARVAREGGAVIYLRGQEGRGVGLLAKLAAYHLQDDGVDTVDAQTSLGLPIDDREYGAAAAILTDLGVDRVTLLTNNPAKVHALRDLGIAVDAVAPIIVASNLHNEFYLRTKRERMGHWLPSAPAEQIAKGA